MDKQVVRSGCDSCEFFITATEYGGRTTVSVCSLYDMWWHNNEYPHPTGCVSDQELSDEY